MSADDIQSDVQVDSDIEPTDEVVAEENLQEKVKKLRAELKEAQAEKQKYLDSWQRAQAEFMNIRKRDEESKKEFVKFANEQLVSDLLGVADSFTMAFANKEAWARVDANWRTGVEYIYSQLIGTLKDHGLTEPDPLNEAFDPSRHMALGNVETKEKEKDHKVLEVIQKGYILNGKVIRPAKVKLGEYVGEKKKEA